MDAYDLQARHAPMIFAILPVVLVAFVLVPALAEMKIVAGTIAAIVVAALPFVMTRIARSAGRARQNELFASWGGIPTTAMLRYRDNRLNARTKRIYRARLANLGPDYPIPTEEEERRDPDGADEKIGAAIDEIRKRAKARAVKAVHRENVNFGASRNLFGLRPYGLGTCALSVLVLALAVASRGGFYPSAAELAVGMAILVIAGIWTFFCTANSVRQHGEAYALALFETI